MNLCQVKGTNAKKTVLLVEDSQFLRRATESIISRAGYLVLVAKDGDEGLQIARNRLPDAIVLDMLLPKLSGLQVLQSLKQDPLTAKIPVIAVSSLPQCNEEKLKGEGAAAYLEKARLEFDTGASGLVHAIATILRGP